MKKNNGGASIKLSAKFITIFGACCKVFFTFLQNKSFPEFILKIPATILTFWIFYLLLYGFGEIVDSICQIRDAYLKSRANTIQRVTSCPHCGATVTSSPCQMCGKPFKD